MYTPVSIFRRLNCHFGLPELPDLTNKSVPQLWDIYTQSINDNMPPLEDQRDDVDPDLVWWIAFNIQLRLFDVIPYDMSCLLEESIRAWGYSLGQKYDYTDLTELGRSLPSDMMNALMTPMRPAKTVEAEQRLLNTWASVSYWQSGNYVLEIPISGFSNIYEAKEFGDSIKSVSRRVKGCSIFTITSTHTKECPSDHVVVHSFKGGGQRHCSCLSELVPTNLEVCQLSMANELVDDYRFLHSICRGDSTMDDVQQHSQQVDWDSIPKDERTWYASHGEIVYSGDVQSTEGDKHHIYEQAIDFFGAGTEESEDFYISQKIPGDPSKGIPSLEIEQVADRITINELTPDGFFQIYESHQEHPQKGWMPDPVANLNLNNLGRILSILGGKVHLATGADMPLTEEVATDKATKVPPKLNTFWITHEASYLKSRMTCVKTTRTLAQARLDAYYILSEGYGAFEDSIGGNELSDIEPSQESVCHLLIKYFGYEICEYGDSATEIDLYDLWNWTQDDIHPTNKSWYKWLELSRFRWGFYSELMAVMEGRLNVDALPQYPWNSQHRSITGWDCGEYIIEVPFCSFNSEAEAEEFGQSCFALQTDEKHPSLFQLFYGDGEQACLRKNNVIVYRKPSMSYEVNPNDRDAWEVTDLSAEDIPDLEISGPLYCQGRELGEKGGLHHAN